MPPPLPALPALPPEWLRSFVLFAETLNFSRAARALHLSQPAVHGHVRRLAEALAQPLYEKRGQRLSLTAAGERVEAFGRELEERTRRLCRELGSGAAAEPVVLSAGEGAYLYLLGEPIERFTRDGHPLRLLTRDAVATAQAVLSGEAHVGVAVLDAAPGALETAEIARVGQLLAMPRGHPLSRKKRLSLTDLDGARLVVPPAGRPQRALLEQALLSEGVGWQVAVEASGWPLLLHFVRLGIGLAVVNSCCSLPEGVVARPLPDLPRTRYVALRRRGPEAEGPREILWRALAGHCLTRSELRRLLNGLTVLRGCG